MKEQQSSATSAAVKDPVCGMDVHARTAQQHEENDGVDYYFCSAHCRAKFVADPAAYRFDRRSDHPIGVAHHHAHHEGDDGHDGYDGDRSAPATSPEGEVAEYTCPMHPEIRQPGPGACPICGMALEPVVVAADTGPSAELSDMTRRFWIAVALTIPVLVLEMG